MCVPAAIGISNHDVIFSPAARADDASSIEALRARNAGLFDYVRSRVRRCKLAFARASQVCRTILSV